MIKANEGSLTAGTDGKTIADIKKLTDTEVVNLIQNKLENYALGDYPPCHAGSLPSHSFVLPLKGGMPILAPLQGRSPYGMFSFGFSSASVVICASIEC